MEAFDERRERGFDGNGGVGFGGVADCGEEAFHGVNGIEDDVEDGAFNTELAFAGEVKEVFGGMGELADLFEVEKASDAFDGVEAAEDGVDGVGVFRGGFEFEKFAFGGFDMGVGFADEFGDEREVFFGEEGFDVRFGECVGGEGRV